MRRTRLGRFSALAIGSALAGLVTAGPAAALDVGQKAPDFTLAAPGGKQVKLSDLTAKGPVVLYTFIQAFTGP
jgi:thioredoxin-dependent peroxiredoxin